MESHVIYLLYLALILSSGVFITTISNKFSLSNILFLILLGFMLEFAGLNYFGEPLVLFLSALTIIMAALEASLHCDIPHIRKNFTPVLKSTILNFILSMYILTLITYEFFPGLDKNFEIFTLCLILSVLMFGVDPGVISEFSRKKRGLVFEHLEVEGLVAGPMVVVFAFFLIHYLHDSTKTLEQAITTELWQFLYPLGICIVISLTAAFLFYRFMRRFHIPKVLFGLFLISVAILLFGFAEFYGAPGGFAVVLFGLFVQGLTREKLNTDVASIFAHTLYLIVFILLGTSFLFPSFEHWWVVVFLFLVHLLLRFITMYFFVRLPVKRLLFMSLTSAKGIEVGVILLVLQIEFSHIDGIEHILGIGYLFFIFGYITSTIVYHFSHWFLHHEGHFHHAIHEEKTD